MVTKKVIQLGDDLRNDQRTIRELVIFSDEEITDEKIEDRKREVLKQIEAVKKARLGVQKTEEKLETVPKKEKRKDARARGKMLRSRIELSQRIREIEFTELVKRRMIDEIKEQVEAVQRTEREIVHYERQLNPPKGKKPSKLKEEEKKLFLKRIKDLKTHLKTQADDLQETPEVLLRTLDKIQKGEWEAEVADPVAAVGQADDPASGHDERAEPDPVGERLDIGPDRPAAALLGVAQHHVEVAGQAAVDRRLGGGHPLHRVEPPLGPHPPDLRPVAQNGDLGPLRRVVRPR